MTRCTSCAGYALIHAVEEGVSTPMLMTPSGHASFRVLSRSARLSVGVRGGWHAEHDAAVQAVGAR